MKFFNEKFPEKNILKKLNHSCFNNEKSKQPEKNQKNMKIISIIDVEKLT